jgi:hypothetical protein
MNLKNYTKKFKKGKYDFVPNIGDFILDQPTEDDEDDYNFVWMRITYNKYNKV